MDKTLKKGEEQLNRSITNIDIVINYSLVIKLIHICKAARFNKLGQHESKNINE